MFVYLLYNKINGKYYVGKTVSINLNRYLSVKRWAARHRKNYPMPIVRAMAKYGIDNFSVDILAVPNGREELGNLERIWILFLDSRNPKLGYNVWPGGDIGRLGIPCSEEAKKKIGAANKGRKPMGYIRTELHRQQLRDRMMGNRLGTKFTSESARLAIKNETPENKAKRIAGIQRAWDRRRGINTVESNT